MEVRGGMQGTPNEPGGRGMLGNGAADFGPSDGIAAGDSRHQSRQVRQMAYLRRRGSVHWNFGFLEHRAQVDSVFQNSPFFVALRFSKYLEIHAVSRTGPSTIRRIRALDALFQNRNGCSTNQGQPRRGESLIGANDR